MRRLGIATLLMAASVLLSRVVGFVREIVIAAQHGATGATDAYFTAFTLPDMLNYFLAGGTLTITFIPLFSEHLARGDEEGGWDLFSTIATGTGVLVVAAMIFGMIAAPDLVPLIAPGFDDHQIALCARMTRIVMPGMLCFTIGGLLQATILAKERFAAVASIPIIYNVAIIAGGLLLGPWLGVEGFAWGALAGALIGPLGVPLWVTRRDLRYRPRFNFNSTGFRAYIKLALPLMLGVTLISLDEWLLRHFGSRLDRGTISWLNNARRLMLVPVAIVGQAAGQAAMPFLSALWAEGKRDEMADTLTRAIRSVLFYAVLSSAALLTLAEPLVFAAFRRGSFSSADAAGTASLLSILALGVAAWSVQNIIARGFYARHDTLQPMILGTAVAALCAPLYWSLSNLLGGQGLAIASAAGITLNATALLALFRWRCAPIDITAIARTLALALTCSIPAAAAAHATLSLLTPWLSLDNPWHALALLLAAGIVFASLALALAALLKVEELAFVRRLLARLRPKAP